ncbi:hypothetical protein [Legionella nagasakiensis]|uniref:hypothetical protein n=1 Tax=Legionella nagasakiensis TaxID=535290 RepID=UPI001056D77A|nr:hypothetical protein [Legionella nagasakiensis]
MLVRCIKEFIEHLNKCSTRAEFDQKFLNELSEKFASIDDDECLSEDQVQYVLNGFANRWQSISDTAEDYTFYPGGNNVPWVQLAKAFASETGRTYLQILMPTVVNVLDPNNFSRLTDCVELRGFYCSDDKKILYRIRGLFEHLQNGHVFSTRTNFKSHTLSPLSLHELMRIRAKRGDGLQFELSANVYQNFWDYLERTIMPTWQDRGECPRHLLPGLVELIETFFADKSENLSVFRKQLLQWMNYLQTSPIDDVNWLYGQCISIAGENIYLVNIFLDCLQENKSTLHNKIIGLARWLCQHDASLIVQRSELDGLYEELAVGASFNVAKMQELLATLIRVSPKLHTKLLDLQTQLNESTVISPQMIVSLRAIYSLRWSQVGGREMDYTRIQGSKNAPWIVLAQYLAGAGYIEKNYYKFLMPTLEHDTDPVRLECLTTFPLSHYILSEDSNRLILLDNCVARYRIQGTFYKINETAAEPLTLVEEERIAYANPRFHKYSEIIHRQASELDPPISLTTILAIKSLVDGSLYPNGLLYGYDYDKAQMAMAEKAYGIFAQFLDQLPRNERQRLDRQHIVFDGRRLTFAQVLREVQQDECIAVYGQYLAQLVMDYAPYLRFREEIERRVDVEGMRINSRKKILRSYETLNETEALMRIMIIFKSLLTRDFYFWPLHGVLISEFGTLKTVPSEVGKIVSVVMPMIKSGDFSSATFVYAEMMESVIKPALKDRSWGTWMTRTNDTQEWLASIADQTLYLKKSAWFDSKLLLVALFPLTQCRSFTCPALEIFLDKLVRIYLSSENRAVKEIYINIQFEQFLTNLDVRTRARILKTLQRFNPNHVDDDKFNEACTNQLIHRLAIIGTKMFLPSQIGFFNHRTGCHASTYEMIRDDLQKRIAGHTHSLGEVIKRLQAELAGEATVISSGMTRYLRSMISTFTLPSHSDSELSLSASVCSR